MIRTKWRRIGVMIAVLALMLGMHAGPGDVQAAPAGIALLAQPRTQSLVEFTLTIPSQSVESITSSNGTQVGSGTVAVQARGEGSIAIGQAMLALQYRSADSSWWQINLNGLYESRVTYAVDGRRQQMVSLQGQGEMTDQRGITRFVTSTFVVENTSSTTNLDVVVVFDVSASPTSPPYRVTYRLRPTGTLRVAG